ncbi:MAG: DUF502 domain-containing protein [Candidatus Scalindua rubra]|uniref:DUF502 domain-containing protein n=1 Tax=Candidatus Scalindua brodae TaxID=237368 RepID=A0A0B0EL90_9BACT|nr:MAG: hypothetical protein SCABRO_02414 [Candidatus Scalindua brodae]MBZ0108975.1 DUF502 domain-containing protein [Candidatus Scalindua rubra]TWU36404.1 hypothetical protein S225a_06830 [Candidatus Brocadiaceae bacterium S225]
MKRQMKHHLRKYLIAGILFILPVGITLFFLRFLMRISAGNIVKITAQYWDHAHPFLSWGISLAIFILFLYGLGIFATHIIGRRLIAFGEKIIMWVPLLKTIYGVSKQVVNAFIDPNREAFKSVVLVEFPQPGVRVIGFITGKIEDTQGQNCYKVFVPTSPNPTSGFFLIVRSDEIQHTNLSVEDGMKMIVSGGIVAPSTIQEA